MNKQFLFGLLWGIYWVLLVQLTILCPYQILVSESVDVMFMKHIAYNKKFVHLQIGLSVSIFRGFRSSQTLNPLYGDQLTKLFSLFRSMWSQLLGHTYFTNGLILSVLGCQTNTFLKKIFIFHKQPAQGKSSNLSCTGQLMCTHPFFHRLST